MLGLSGVELGLGGGPELLATIVADETASFFTRL